MPPKDPPKFKSFSRNLSPARYQNLMMKNQKELDLVDKYDSGEINKLCAERDRIRLLQTVQASNPFTVATLEQINDYNR